MYSLIGRSWRTCIVNLVSCAIANLDVWELRKIALIFYLTIGPLHKKLIGLCRAVQVRITPRWSGSWMILYRRGIGSNQVLVHSRKFLGESLYEFSFVLLEPSLAISLIFWKDACVIGVWALLMAAMILTCRIAPWPEVPSSSTNVQRTSMAHYSSSILSFIITQ